MGGAGDRDQAIGLGGGGMGTGVSQIQGLNPFSPFLDFVLWEVIIVS